MTSRDFCFWLQGFIEITAAGVDDLKPIDFDGKQISCIRKHLSLVFKHEIDPSMGPSKEQVILSEAHNNALVRC